MEILAVSVYGCYITNTYDVRKGEICNPLIVVGPTTLRLSHDYHIAPLVWQGGIPEIQLFKGDILQFDKSSRCGESKGCGFVTMLNGDVVIVEATDNNLWIPEDFYSVEPYGIKNPIRVGHLLDHNVREIDGDSDACLWYFREKGNGLHTVE